MKPSLAYSEMSSNYIITQLQRPTIFSVGLFCIKETKNMISAQIERLRKDSRELGSYIKKLEKKGRSDLIHKVSKKQQFIDQHIEDVLTVVDNRRAN